MSARVEALAVSLTSFDADDCLVYGIGNIGRQDDGLGWAFIDWLEDEGICGCAERMRHYQLHLEDADLISRKRRVLFIDATKDVGVDTFALERVQPLMDFSFTSHAISVQTVLATCQQCFETTPDVYLLTIRGYQWELEEGMTVQALANLEQAQRFMTGGKYPA